ncbi:MAG: arylesterase [Novosphingobium sp.]
MKWKLVAALASPLLLLGCKESVAPIAPQPSAVAAEAPAADAVPVLALGDSLFAGYGLNPGQSYPAHLEKALRARRLPVRIVNAGVSGDTTADGLARIEFVLKGMNPKPALAIVSLGGNDMLRAVPPVETRKNLEAILSQFKQAKVPVVLLQLLAAPNLGKEYADQFNPIYPELAKQYGATMVPFWLAPLQGHPELLQGDHIHPTLEGIDKLVAATADQVAAALPKTAAQPAPR